MAEVLPGNGLASSLQSGMSAGATTLAIAAADAPKWPPSGEYRAVLCQDPTGGPFELVKVTGGQGTANLTVARAAEAYNGDQTARVWPSGTSIAAVITQASLQLAAGGGITLPLTQNLTWSPDNTYDIGAYGGPGRPRYLYVAGGVVTPFVDTVGGPLVFSVNGGAMWQIPSAGHLQAAGDNVFDIGAAATGRPRDLFLGRNLTVGGLLIKGELSNNTDTSRLFFQTSVASGRTVVSAMPAVGNGYAAYRAYDTSPVATGNFVEMGITFGSSVIVAGIAVGGTYGPLSFSTGGQSRWRIETTGQLTAVTDNAYDIGAAASRPRSVYIGTSLLLPDGSATAPSLTFAADTNTGIYRSGNEKISFVGNGQQVFMVDGTDTVQPRMVLGTDPANNFYIDQWGNFRWTSGQQLVLQMGNAERWAFRVNGNLEALYDNTLDIGNSGGSRPRDLFLAGRVVLGAAGANALAPIIRTTPTMPKSLSVESPGEYAFIGGRTAGVLLGNAYFDGTSYQRYDTGQPAAYIHASAGAIQLQTAAAGANPITFVPRLSIDAAGALTVSGTAQFNSWVAISAANSLYIHGEVVQDFGKPYNWGDSNHRLYFDSANNLYIDNYFASTAVAIRDASQGFFTGFSFYGSGATYRFGTGGNWYQGIPRAGLHIRGSCQAGGVGSIGWISGQASPDTGWTGMALIQDYSNSTGNGGALYFGAATGFFAGMKAYVTDGGGYSGGYLSIGARRLSTTNTLTEYMRIGNINGVEIATGDLQTYGNVGFNGQPAGNGNYGLGLPNANPTGYAIATGWVLYSCVDHALEFNLPAEPITDPVGKLKVIQPYYYQHAQIPMGSSEPDRDERGQIISHPTYGMRASEVASVLPELARGDTIDYTRMVVVLWAACQEMERRLAALEGR